MFNVQKLQMSAGFKLWLLELKASTVTTKLSIRLPQKNSRTPLLGPQNIQLFKNANREKGKYLIDSNIAK